MPSTYERSDTMLTFMLYCDMSKIKASSNDITTILKEFSDSYIQLNDCVWFFKYPDGYNGSPLHKEEFLFYEYFEQLTDNESTIMICRMNDVFYDFPDTISHFLEQD